MAQITSRKELEEWLKDKPIEWAQVIAARAALRALPYAFAAGAYDKWVVSHSLTLFRATVISWAVRNFPAHDMGKAARTAARTALFAAFTAAADADTFVDLAAFADLSLDAAVFTEIVSDAALASAAASFASASAAFAAALASVSFASASASAAFAVAPFSAAAWANIGHDCDWLTSEGDAASASWRLTREPLFWPAGAPKGWSEAWVSATECLTALNQGHSVWIDWYDRRIKGECAAFEIPGDHDRAEDKAILAHLAEATNEDFWDKGATHVNTMLQGWIMQARKSASAKAAMVAEIEMAKSPKSAASDRINFFISYATVDEAMAREVEAVLAELGYTSIAQFKDFKQSSFVRSMREGLAKSERFIALYSKAYWSSDHCQSEWDAAYARDPGAKQRKIVPFLIEAMDLRQQPLASEIVYEPLHGLSKDERKKAIKQMIEYRSSARLS